MAGEELHVCLLCGRDTRNRSELCRQCSSGKRSYRSEEYGRGARHMASVNDEEQDEETSETRYHGDNWEG